LPTHWESNSVVSSQSLLGVVRWAITCLIIGSQSFTKFILEILSLDHAQVQTLQTDRRFYGWKDVHLAWLRGIGDQEVCSTGVPDRYLAQYITALQLVFTC
jgi:hypothetical protein